MRIQRLSAFEIILLVSGVAVGILGFKLINQLYIIEGTVGWLMIIAIFNWLMLLVLFISLSLSIDVSKKQLRELKNLFLLISIKKSRRR